MATLGRLDTTPPLDIDEGISKLKTFEDAVATVMQRVGGALPGRPDGFDGNVPRDITALDDEQLGNLLNNLSAWCGFVEVEYAKALSAFNEAEKQYDYVESVLRHHNKNDPETGKKLTVQERNDLVRINPTLVDLSSKLLYQETIYQLFRVLKDKTQRDWDTVSRRITQRGQSIERQKRESNVAGTTNAQMGGQRRFHRPSSN